MIRHKRYSTSSIGAVWPPTFATYNRLRGLYPESVDTRSQMSRFIQEFTYYREMAQLSSIDRSTIRYVGSTEFLHLLPESAIQIEGVIPLACTHSHYLIYTRWNSPTRTAATERVDRHRNLLEQTRSQQIRTNNIETVAESLGLRIQLLTRTTAPSRRASEIPRFSDIYRAFGRSEQDAAELVLDVNNTIAYLVAPDGTIVCTTLVEQARIPIAGHGMLNLYEVAEGATRSDYQGRGLYRGLSAFLIDIIRDESSAPIDAIYGECNLSAPGVVYAARQNGRRFVYEDRHLYDITSPDFGILCQNYKVHDGEESWGYNDFVLTYVDLAAR